MKFLLLPIILIFSLPAFGQIITNSIAGEEAYRAENKTFVEYDSSKDQTTVYSPHMLFYKSQGTMHNMGELISANFLFRHEGRSLTSAPAMIDFRFISHANNLWKFEDAKSRQLTVSINGETLINTTLERISTRKFPNINVARMRFVEVLATPLSFENFQKIKNGTKVVVQIGRDYKYKLSKNDLKMIDEFISKQIPVKP
jgi:hypothetical protein